AAPRAAPFQDTNKLQNVFGIIGVVGRPSPAGKGNSPESGVTCTMCSALTAPLVYGMGTAGQLTRLSAESFASAP
ncbi:MAG: hypothetical protein DMG49_21445, partial [Acidobacteria bacterium]